MASDVEIWYNIMMFKMSLLLDKIQQACDVEIWYNIMQFKMSLLLDKIQQACDVEIWYNNMGRIAYNMRYGNK